VQHAFVMPALCQEGCVAVKPHNAGALAMARVPETVEFRLATT
jgi:hypothetical protein